MYTALDVQQQSIIRRAGPFVKPTSLAEAKPGLKEKPICVRSSAISAPKKKRTRGKSRKNLGILAHPAPPPLTPRAKKPKTSTPVPAEYQAHRGFQTSLSGEEESSPPAWARHCMPPPSSLAQVDLRECLAGNQDKCPKEGTLPLRLCPRVPALRTRKR